MITANFIFSEQCNRLWQFCAKSESRARGPSYWGVKSWLSRKRFREALRRGVDKRQRRQRGRCRRDEVGTNSDKTIKQLITAWHRRSPGTVLCSELASKCHRQRGLPDRTEIATREGVCSEHNNIPSQTHAVVAEEGIVETLGEFTEWFRSIDTLRRNFARIWQTWSKKLRWKRIGTYHAVTYSSE